MKNKFLIMTQTQLNDTLKYAVTYLSEYDNFITDVKAQWATVNHADPESIKQFFKSYYTPYNVKIERLKKVLSVFPTPHYYKGLELKSIFQFDKNGFVNASNEKNKKQLRNLMLYVSIACANEIVDLNRRDKGTYIKLATIHYVAKYFNNLRTYNINDAVIYNPLTIHELQDIFNTLPYEEILQPVVMDYYGRVMSQSKGEASQSKKSKIERAINDFLVEYRTKPTVKQLAKYLNDRIVITPEGPDDTTYTPKRLYKLLDRHNLGSMVEKTPVIVRKSMETAEPIEQPTEPIEQPVEVEPTPQSTETVEQPVETPQPQQHRVVEHILSLDECVEWATENKPTQYNYGPDPSQWSDDELTRFVLGEKPSESESESEATTTPLAKDLF